MKKCLLTMLIGLLCGALHAADIDYTHMKPLKLTVPEMKPQLDCSLTTTYRPELEVYPGDHSPWAKENWTWMHTNPGVKPYKVMDDLSFVGLPIFDAGLII